MRRKEEFHFRLSEEESRMLNEKSKKYGVSRTKLLRNYIRDKITVSTDMEKVIRELTISINKIGTNINQIAKKANETGLSRNDILSLKVYQRELSNMVKVVIENCDNQDITHEAK